MHEEVISEGSVPLAVRSLSVSGLHEDEPEFPMLHGPRLRLCALEEAHVEPLRGLFNDPRLLPLWSRQTRAPATQNGFADYLRRLHEEVGAFFTIVRRSTDGPVGFAYLYNLNPWIREVSTALVLEFGHETGLGIEAGYLLFDWAFSYWPLDRILDEVIAYNAASRSLHEKIGCTLEFIDPNGCYFDGHTWAVYHYALSRERWGVLRHRFSRRIHIADTGDDEPWHYDAENLVLTEPWRASYPSKDPVPTKPDK